MGRFSLLLKNADEVRKRWDTKEQIRSRSVVGAAVNGAMYQVCDHCSRPQRKRDCICRTLLLLLLVQHSIVTGMPVSLTPLHPRSSRSALVSATAFEGTPLALFAAMLK